MTAPPIPPGAPARITSIPGLNTLLQNENWQLLASARASAGNQSSAFTVAGGIKTSRINFIPSWSTSHIRIVYIGYCGQHPAEAPNWNTIYHKVSVEPSALGSETTLNTNRLNVWFNNLREGILPPWQILISDPVEIQATAGQPFFVWTRPAVPGSGYLIPLPVPTFGGTGPGGSNNGEGQTNSVDTVDVGTMTQNATNAYAPLAILGYSATPQRSMAIVGDSIPSGTEDGGTGLMGYAMRAAMGQTSVIAYQYPVTPLFPCITVSRGSDTAANWVTWTLSQERMRLAMYASTVFCDYGTNDSATGQTAAQLQANLLALSLPFLQRGKKFIQSTYFPRTTSTDCWTTANNQTDVGGAARATVNTWLRDTSAAGFVAQAAANAGVSPSMVSVYDIAAPFEVNSSGVLTPNGGFWLPNTGSPVITGTATGSNTTQLLNASGLSMTQDQYRGYTIRATSGAQNNVQASVTGNGTNFFNVASAWAAGLTAGDTFSVYNTAYTNDGIHPTSLGHLIAAQNFPVNQVV